MELNTTGLDNQNQRRAPVETMAVVIGTVGSPSFIHLHLEMMQRMFGNTLPVLVVNDGDEQTGIEIDQLKGVVAQYEFAGLKLRPYIGHSTGDIRVFLDGLEWADRINADLLIKFSRRFIPLENWRHELYALSAKNRNVAAFTRRVEGGLFRTDCIALRVRKWMNDETRNSLEPCLELFWKKVSVEPMLEALAKANGGWAEWGLAGSDFYRPWHRALQWRGLPACVFGDYARELGLPYGDEEFVPIIGSTDDSRLPDGMKDEDNEPNLRENGCREYRPLGGEKTTLDPAPRGAEHTYTPPGPGRTIIGKPIPEEVFMAANGNVVEQTPDAD